MIYIFRENFVFFFLQQKKWSKNVKKKILLSRIFFYVVKYLVFGTKKRHN